MISGGHLVRFRLAGRHDPTDAPERRAETPNPRLDRGQARGGAISRIWNWTWAGPGRPQCGGGVIEVDSAAAAAAGGGDRRLETPSGSPASFPAAAPRCLARATAGHPPLSNSGRRVFEGFGEAPAGCGQTTSPGSSPGEPGTNVELSVNADADMNSSRHRLRAVRHHFDGTP